MNNKYLNSLVITVILACTTACGYQFAGSGDYPAGVTRIYVMLLENRSGETGLESTFTNDLLYEFTRNREASLAPDAASADGILRGVIQRVYVETITRTSVETAVERRVTGVLSLRLESPGGRLLWASDNIVESQAFDVVGGNKIANDQKKAQAIDAVSRKLAEAAFRRLTDSF